MRLRNILKTDNSRQSGDTIVEVAISIAVISVVLVGAFAVTNRSLMAVRDSQEHAQALSLLQGQVELLRTAAGQNNFFPANFVFSNPFCLDATSGAIQIYPSPSNSSSNCTQDSLYNLAISSSSPTSSPPLNATMLFNLTATWHALGGGLDQVQLSYKVQVL